MKITLIRHAQSLFNVVESELKDSEQFIDCSLTELGIAQSKELNDTFDLLITSPLQRSQLTYFHSNISSDRVIILDSFREVKTDYCDFLHGEEIKLESDNDATLRVETCLNYLKTLSYNRIGIITHGDFIHHFMKTCFDIEIWLDNCQQVSFDI